MCTHAGKLLAFSGPSNAARIYYGYKSFVPEDYWTYFKARGVTAVVRLNKAVCICDTCSLCCPIVLVVSEFGQQLALYPHQSTWCNCLGQRDILKVVEARCLNVSHACGAMQGLTCFAMRLQMYEASRFAEGGFRHYDLYFPDGSCPSEAIRQRFMEIAETEAGMSCVPANAVQCKATKQQRHSQQLIREAMLQVGQDLCICPVPIHCKAACAYPETHMNSIT